MRRRLLAGALVCAAALLLGADPASAHTVAGVGPTNLRTVLDEGPDLPGVTVRVVELGSRFELRNASDAEVVVLGYLGEPYLRIGPDGVFENELSQATYINRDRQGEAAVPEEATAATKDTPPRWTRVSSERVARWHDHRIHYMGEGRPRIVRDPDRRYTVVEWSIPLRSGSTSAAATGRLLWVPGPSPLPWVAVAAVLALGTIALGRPRSARALRILAALAIALVTADVARAFGIGLSSADALGTQVTKTLGANLFSVLGWVAGGIGAWFAAHRREEGLFGVAFAAIVVALFGGLNDVGALSRSQMPSVVGAVPIRALVAAILGLGVGLAVASARILSRPPAVGAEAEDPVVQE